LGVASEIFIWHVYVFICSSVGFQHAVT
jgi:hypothetical protein